MAGSGIEHMSRYVGIIHKDRKSDYSVCFPDFPGCITAGDTPEEAHEMAEEALGGHIEIMMEYGDKIPRPMSMDEAMKHEFAKGALAFFKVEAALPRKPRRINIMLDENLIREIDRVTDNRSAFLAEAARELLRDKR